MTSIKMTLQGEVAMAAATLADAENLHEGNLDELRAKLDELQGLMHIVEERH